MTWAEFLRLWRWTMKRALIADWPSVVKMTTWLEEQAKRGGLQNVEK